MRVVGQFKRLALPAVVAAALLGAGVAHAEIVISNLSATLSSGLNATLYSQAVGFTTPASPLYLANSVTVRLNNTTAGDYTINAWLYSDVTANPGALLSTFTPAVAPVGLNEIIINLPSSYALEAATTYWIVVEAADPQGNIFFTTASAAEPTGIFAFAGGRYDDAGWIDLQNWPGGVFTGQSHIWALDATEAAPVPAIPGWGLLLFGFLLAVIGVVAMQRRRTAGKAAV